MKIITELSSLWPLSKKTLLKIVKNQLESKSEHQSPNSLAVVSDCKKKCPDFGVTKNDDIMKP